MFDHKIKSILSSCMRYQLLRQTGKPENAEDLAELERILCDIGSGHPKTRRRHVRHTTAYSVLCIPEGGAVGAERMALMRNLSATGAYLEIEGDLPLGERLELTIRDPNDGCSWSIPATVVRGSAEGAGVAFSGPPLSST